MTIKEVLNELDRRGISIPDVAHYLKIDRSTVHKWYDGTIRIPRSSSVRKLQDVFSISAVKDPVTGAYDFNFNAPYYSEEQLVQAILEVPRREYRKMLASGDLSLARDEYMEKIDTLRELNALALKLPIDDIRTLIRWFEKYIL